MPRTHPRSWPYRRPVVIVGFGSIGQGTLPLIERHFTYDPHDVHVIEPSDEHAAFLAQRGVDHIHAALTRENYREILAPLFRGSAAGSASISRWIPARWRSCGFAGNSGVLYIDTVVEPWPGFYFDLDADPSERTNYALREAMRAEKRAQPGGTTAVSCCGANPGMVSWLLKEALLRLAADTGVEVAAARDPRRLGRN